MITNTLPAIFPARSLTESELPALCDLEVVVRKEHEAKVKAATTRLTEAHAAVGKAKAEVQALTRWQELKETWRIVCKGTKEDFDRLGLSLPERKKVGEELTELEAPIRQAEEDLHDAQNDYDSTLSELHQSLIRAAYLTGQVSGLRLGYELGVNQAMGYPLDLAGFADGVVAIHVALAMVDDDIAQDILQDLLETKQAHKRRDGA